MHKELENSSAWPGNFLRLAGWSGVVVILLLPLVAMQFTDEVNWTLFDFIFAGTLLIGTSIAAELTVRHVHDIRYRLATGLALAAAFLLLWINGAVGIIGTSSNAANMPYNAVPFIAIAIALLARFKPGGMALAMLITAFAQGIVTIIGFSKNGMQLDALGLNGFFIALWIASAWLFRKAAH